MSKAVFTFGRMNPPTIGHQKLVDKVKAEAEKRGAMPHVYMSHSQDKKKNPLDYNTKFLLARKAFGPSVTQSKARTIIEVMKELESMNHDEVVLVVGSDRVNEFKTLLNRYNGKDYNFKKIQVVSAGERDPDSDDVSGMSASKLRAYAQAGDYDSFKKGTPPALSEKDKKAIYDQIRSVMEEIVIEDIDDDEIEISDLELDAYIDIIELESLDEEDQLDEEFEEYLELQERAPLSITQRMAIGRRMKRLQPRIQRQRKIRAKKLADKSRLEKRARKAAINILRKKFAGKQGENYASLAPGSKMAVDRIVQKKMALVGKISKRLMPKIRKAEMERLKKARSRNEAVSPAQQAAIAKKESGKYDKEGKRIKEQKIWEEEDDATNTKLMSMLRQAFRDPSERMLVIHALKGGEKSLQNPKLRPFILKLLNRLLDATQDDPSMLAKMRDKLRRMGQAEEDMQEREDPDIGDRKGSQPAKYHAGLSVSTKKKRDAHFKKHGPMADDDPRGYKPAPGDATAKTKPSKYTRKYKQMYGEDLNAAFEKFIAEEYIEEKAIEGLKKKAEKSGIPYGILKQVYNRGMAAWQTGHRPGTTPQQWAFARVNSFLTGGKTRTTTDADLWAKAKGRKTQKEGAVDDTKAAIEREKEADKRKFDRMMDRARTRDTQAKNRATESVDEAFESYLEEGINDPAIFKAVFLAGGPGSGKSFVVKKTGLASMGFVVINSDDAFERALKKAGLSTTPEDIFSVQGQEIRGGAMTLTAKRQETVLKGRLGIVVDGTGRDYDKIQQQVQILKDIGYDVGMIFVNTDMETALERNRQRERTLPDDTVEKMWKDVQKNMGKFQRFFGQNFQIVDNSIDSNFEVEIQSAYKMMRKFAEKTIMNPKAKKWIEQEKKKRGISETVSEITLKQLKGKALGKIMSLDKKKELIKQINDKGLNAVAQMYGVDPTFLRSLITLKQLKGKALGKTMSSGSDKKKELIKQINDKGLNAVAQMYGLNPTYLRSLTESVHDNCGTTDCCGQCDTAVLSEGFTAGISDTMYAKDFEEHKVHGGFTLHPSVMEQGGAGEEGTRKLVKKYKKDTPGETSEAIEFMKKHDIDIVENIYRPLSEKYFEFFREARRMMEEGEIEFSELDKQILQTDLGEFDIYEGMEVPLDCPMVHIEEEEEPELNKPKRGGSKKYYVYVRTPSTGNIKKVEWGDTSGLKVKINDPAARKSFAARHKCDTRNDKTKPSYWACRLPRYAKSLGLQVDNPGSWW